MVIHNSLTHIIKSVYMNGGNYGNKRPTDGKRNSPFFYPDKCSVCPLFVTRQTSAP